ncbi:hypothetical protein BU17DRAFT_93895 [Hysterangium stoloniferum]|nr:hypothetical protein BU17DRAFT_93895 [Hysterangium stoloniferum]
MLAAVFTVLVYTAWVFAYIPAIATNDTNAANQTDTGTYSSTISSELVENNSTGFHQRSGPLFGVTFEQPIKLSNKHALDRLGELRHQHNGCFPGRYLYTGTDRGAVATLLYSSTSETCLINPEYASSDNSDQILDIFGTKSKSSALLVLSQLSNLYNTSFMTYDPTLLNNSFDSVIASFVADNTSSGFIIATLLSANSSIPINGSDTGSNYNPSQNG